MLNWTLTLIRNFVTWLFIFSVQMTAYRSSTSNSTGIGFIHHRGRNGKFCLAVDPVTRTSGVLAYCKRFGSNPCWLNCQRRWDPSWWTSRSMHKSSSKQSWAALWAVLLMRNAGFFDGLSVLCSGMSWAGKTWPRRLQLCEFLYWHHIIALSILFVSTRKGISNRFSD